jgi:hypothetical protein
MLASILELRKGNEEGVRQDKDESEHPKVHREISDSEFAQIRTSSWPIWVQC